MLLYKKVQCITLPFSLTLTNCIEDVLTTWPAASLRFASGLHNEVYSAIVLSCT